MSAGWIKRQLPKRRLYLFRRFLFVLLCFQILTLVYIVSSDRIRENELEKFKRKVSWPLIPYRNLPAEIEENREELP